MKEYKVQKGDTLESLAKSLGMPSAYTLKTFHNFKGPIEKGIGNEIKEGMILTIPEPHEVEAINKEIADRQKPVPNPEEGENNDPEGSQEDASAQGEATSTDEKKQDKKEHKEDKKESQEKAAGEHDGKLLVAQKGKAMCDKGNQFPQFKVTSHQKYYVNDEGGSSDYLAVTESDTQFTPPAMPFGSCALKNNQPCNFSPAGKWQKFYTDVKVMGHCVLTEISELQCAVGGKIKVMDHGQRAELTKQNFKNTDKKVHQYINPVVDLEEFNDDLEEQDTDAY